MPESPLRRSSREYVQRHRERRRKDGLRPVQFWLPDVNSPAFLAEARRQCAVLAASPHAAEDQAFVDDLSGDVLSDEAW